MKHYTSPREKKVLILGLVAMLAVPEAQLPPEVRPGMPQVSGGEGGRGVLGWGCVCWKGGGKLPLGSCVTSA